jgi:hypothetical protein
MFNFKGIRQLFTVTDVSELLDISHYFCLKIPQHIGARISLCLQMEQEKGKKLLWLAYKLSWVFCYIQEYRLNLSNRHTG